jgi:hypothetical protein
MLVYGFAAVSGGPPAFRRMWGMGIWIPFFAGALIARAASGLRMGQRVVRGMIGGAVIGLFAGIAPYITALGPIFGTAVLEAGAPIGLAAAKSGVGMLLLFGVLGLAGAVIAETRKP